MLFQILMKFKKDIEKTFLFRHAYVKDKKKKTKKEKKEIEERENIKKAFCDML